MICNGLLCGGACVWVLGIKISSCGNSFIGSSRVSSSSSSCMTIDGLVILKTFPDLS